MKSLRQAFTLVEILVSVLILSGSIVMVLKIHSQNHKQVVYITERNKHVLEDSFFLDQSVLRYHKSEKNAYDIVFQEVRIDKYESRQLLKKVKRKIYIPEQIRLFADEGESTPSAVLDEIKLKEAYVSSYFHFTIQTF